MQAMRGSQKSLILVARQLGIHIGPNDIPERFKNDERELSPKEMCELAHSFNLKAKSTKITDNELIKLLTKKQQILRLQNGRYVIALRVIDSKDDDKSILFLDTGVTTPKPQQISIKELKKGWDGQVILLKARLKAFEEQSELKLSWLIGESLRNRSVMVQVVIVALILNIFAVVPAVFMMLVLDKVVNYEAYSTLYVITSGVIVAYLFNGILGFLRAYLLDFLSQKVEAKLSVRVFEKLISLPMQRFHRESANFLRFTSQISVIKNTLTQKIFSTALDSVSLLVFIPILFFYSPVLFMVVFSFSILGAIASIIYSKRQRDSMGKVSKAEAKRQEFISVSVNGIENVKGLALEPTLKEQWRELEANFIIASEDMQKKSATLNNISSTINQLMTAMVIFVGVHLVFSGSLSAGILVGFNMLASRVSRPIIDLVTLKTEISKLVQSLQLVSGIVDANTETTARGQKPQLMGQISFRNVEFGYDDNTKILKDVDLEINPRQVIGLTGKSGCGKSTIAKLIQGLYRPQSGIVALDNVDLRLLDLSHIRSQVSLVGSESYFFPGTIRESISRAAPNSSMDKITWAAKKVYAHDEIESFPDGYETFLEENATNLSTGLRQKLAIARALIRNPRVIILDDAITGFDVDSEIKLYDALSDIALGRTVIIVSNRLWHLRICNKIFVLDNGVITQQGSFEELKSLKGFFGETFNKQISVLGFNNPTKKVV
ncbi:MAG: peptidase domain-containing ABC transporter [Alphaproteobacteria bacterium]|tara:strand:- start:9919 stop:12078 length:2160 start_codon:yes stop_codon:yes gene_type:complete